jgi:DNA-binding beta-propeller fold protein YncE
VLDRRSFLVEAVKTVAALRAVPAPLALVTADTEAHVVVVDLATRRVAKRIATQEGPRSIQAVGHGRALVAHADSGVVTLIEGRPPHVRRTLRGFAHPRYTAVSADHRYAYVSDGGSGELAVIDLARARVIHRVGVGDGARHITIDRAGRTLWVALGSSAAKIVVVDISDPAKPRPTRTITPPFLAHDVAFTPSGRYVWVTAGREPRLAVYAAHGHAPQRLVVADAAPQHVSFGPRDAYVASGDAGTLTVHALRDQRVLRRTKIPNGSYNVQRAAGRVLTPSLGTGALTILDPHGRIAAQVHVARNAHDACVV